MIARNVTIPPRRIGVMILVEWN